MTTEQILKCQMTDGCQHSVRYIDTKGYIYCLEHGLQRKQYQQARKLTRGEIRTLMSNRPISYRAKSLEVM